jgi:exopolysaccharide biosynthesis predicted pyruvyltransferase EpsI
MPMTSIVEELKGKITGVLAKYLPPDLGSACVLDPPDHPNVGDCAIFLGEVEFLRNYLTSPVLSYYDCKSYVNSCDMHIGRQPILLFHGGGNFGDIWPQHHLFRLHIMERFPDIPKIQFPQSISFSDPGILDQTRRLIAAQRKFVFLARDESSLAFAQKNFDCEVQLCVDMAFWMADRRRPENQFDVQCLLRTDKEVLVEKRGDIERTLQAAQRRFSIDDWIVDQSNLATLLTRKTTSRWRRYPSVAAMLQGPVFRLREAYAHRRVEYGLDLLARANTVVTDRLHAHIMSVISGLENLVFDSMDGKVSAFYNTWTKADPRSRFLTSVDELGPALAMRSR